MNGARAWRVGVALLALGAALGGAPTARADSPSAARAELVGERASARVGDVISLELTLELAPGERVAEPEWPATPGLRLLDAAWLEPVSDAALRRVLRLRVQALRPGPAAWPPATLHVLDAGARVLRRVDAPAWPIQVASTLEGAHAETPPFGLRHPAPRRAPRAVQALSIAAGIATALAGVAWVALAARRRRRSEAATRAVPAALDAPSAALSRARDTLADDPRAAASLAAAALRELAQARFGVPAVAATTRELRRVAAPDGARADWRALVQLLERLDAARFQRHPDARGDDAGPPPEQVRRSIEDALRAFAARPPAEGPP